MNPNPIVKFLSILCLSFSLGMMGMWFKYSSFMLLDITWFIPLCISSLSLLIFSPSMIFLCLISMVSFFVFSWGYKYMMNDCTPSRFFWLLFSFVCSMLVLVLSNSFFTMMMGWDGLGLTSFLLIMYYSSKYSVDCSFLTLLTNRIGDVIFLMLFPMFMFMGNDCLSWQYCWPFWCFFFWVIAAFTKSAQFPFMSWLPAAMAAPTPVSALVHSSTLVTAGLWVILRLGMEGLWEANLMKWMMWFGIMTSLLSGLLALFEQDVKKLIAFSTLSQLGLMTSILSLGMFWMTLFHICTHALFKAMLFMSAGTLMMMNWGNQSLGMVKGFVGPAKSVIFCIASFNLWGLPFLSAYVSKHMILSHVFMSGMSLLSFLMFILGLILSAAYTFRLLSSILVSNYQIPCKVELKDNVVMLSLSMLCVMSVFTGQFFYISFFVMQENHVSLIFSSLSYLIVGVSFYIYLNSKKSWFKSSLFSFSENINKYLFSLLNSLSESKTVFSPLFLMNNNKNIVVNLNMGKWTSTLSFVSCTITLSVFLTLLFY